MHMLCMLLSKYSGFYAPPLQKSSLKLLGLVDWWEHYETLYLHRQTYIVYTYVYVYIYIVCIVHVL